MECYLVQNGGGNPLNFKVICNPQPETAKENTIWVDTDRIHNYYFSATQPENMAEYDVWFPVGTFSPVAFSVMKKNPVMVYPISAKQMVSGVLVDKTAKSWQSGAWKDWIRHLYNKGDECVSLTGGWTSYKQGDSGYSKGSCVKGTTGITISCNSLQAIATRPVNMIDLTNVSTIELEVSNVSISSGNPGILSVSVVKASGQFSNVDAAAQMNIDASGKMSLDVSSIFGEYYIIFCAWNWSGSGTIQGTLNEMGLLG
jgi:hypothetical protein